MNLLRLFYEELHREKLCWYFAEVRKKSLHSDSHALTEKRRIALLEFQISINFLFNHLRSMVLTTLVIKRATSAVRNTLLHARTLRADLSDGHSTFSSSKVLEKNQLSPVLGISIITRTCLSRILQNLTSVIFKDPFESQISSRLSRIWSFSRTRIQ